MKYNFTDQVRTAVEVATQEAERLGHDCVEPQHLLLALTREREGIAASVLESLSIEPELLRSRMDGVEYRGGEVVSGARFRHTRRAARVLEFAMTESRSHDHGFVGNEHVLLGVFREGSDQVVEALNELGATYEGVLRRTLERIRGAE
jgi:ATP-dependent Clp protease ATP-binding subunit ClpA